MQEKPATIGSVHRTSSAAFWTLHTALRSPATQNSCRQKKSKSFMRQSYSILGFWNIMFQHASGMGESDFFNLFPTIPHPKLFPSHWCVMKLVFAYVCVCMQMLHIMLGTTKQIGKKKEPNNNSRHAVHDSERAQKKRGKTKLQRCSSGEQGAGWQTDLTSTLTPTQTRNFSTDGDVSEFKR